MQSLIISLFLIGVFGACQTPFKIKNESRKNVLITPDYGILSKDDIDIYAWEQNESDPGLHVASNYWFCLPNKNVKLGCDNFGPDPSDKISYSEVNFDVIDGNTTYIIGQRRALEIDVCRIMVKRWRELLNGEKHFCIGAGYLSTEASNGKRAMSWTYDKLKTKKGCTSYFKGYCDPAYWKQFGYPDKPKHF